MNYRTERQLMSGQEAEQLLCSLCGMLGNLLYDKAKEMLDKEREATKTGSSSWQEFTSVCTQLILAEKQYFSLAFFAQKSFLRKDNSAKICFEAIASDCRRIVDASTSADDSLTLIYRQLLTFVNGRIFLIEFYEKLWLFGTNKVRHLDEVVEQLVPFEGEHLDRIEQARLRQLKQLMTWESSGLLAMLRTQQQLERWRFLDALMELDTAQEQLDQLLACVQSRETRRLVFMRTAQQPELLQWLQRLRSGLLSVFTLYFRTVLSRQLAVCGSGAGGGGGAGSSPAGAVDFRSLSCRASADLYGRMTSFQRRCDAALVAVVCAQPASLHGEGYRHPHRPAAAAATSPGCEPPPPFTLAVGCARAANTHHWLWPMVLTVLDDMRAQLTPQRVSCLWRDTPVSQSHYVLPLAADLMLVAVLDGRRSEKDAAVITFMLEMSAAVRCSKIYSQLPCSNK